MSHAENATPALEKRSLGRAARLGLVLLGVPVAVIMMMVYGFVDSFSRGQLGNIDAMVVLVLMLPMDLLAVVFGAIAGACLLRTRRSTLDSILLVQMTGGLPLLFLVCVVWTV